LKSSECEVADRGCEERLGGWDLLLKDSIKAILFSFLSDDRCYRSSEVCVAFFGENFNDVLQSSEDNVSECVGEINGILKVSRGESILAR
jgi:hypothetical protein